jgi:hypothetical protein
MPKTHKKSMPKSPGVVAYFEALARQFQYQSEVLSGVLPHHGERGANNEEHVRLSLTKVLPDRFSVGTGFIVCSDQDSPASRQTDVVIYDEIHNAPLHRELVASVYPVEMVYGAIEVKGTLRPRDLGKILADIEIIRQLAKFRYYRIYGSVPKNPNDATRLVANQREISCPAPAPRTFVFAYSQNGWKDVDGLCKSLQKASRRTSAHIHGLVVLSDGWYVSQEAYAPNGPTFHACAENALMRFVAGVTHSISSMPMGPCSIDRYLQVGERMAVADSDGRYGRN